MFHPLERQAKPAYERPLGLPSDTVSDEEYVSAQTDDRALSDEWPDYYLDTETDELGMFVFAVGEHLVTNYCIASDETEVGGSVDTGPEDPGDRVE